MSEPAIIVDGFSTSAIYLAEKALLNECSRLRFEKLRV
jgi:hypothetical protein